MKKLSPMLSILALAAALISGCGEKDSDPNAKIDAPGYYNGSMNPHGTGAGGPSTGGAKKPGVGQDQ